MIVDAIDHGSRAVERVHLETAKRPLTILKTIPGIAGIARAVETVHEAIVTTSYEGVRTIARAVADAIDAVVSPDRASAPEPEEPEPEAVPAEAAT